MSILSGGRRDSVTAPGASAKSRAGRPVERRRKRARNKRKLLEFFPPGETGKREARGVTVFRVRGLHARTERGRTSAFAERRTRDNHALLPPTRKRRLKTHTGLGTTEPEIHIFAGGGTGGHLYPGLAVAEQLLRVRPAARVVFACSDRDVDRRILDPAPHAVVPQPVRPLPKRAGQVRPFLGAWYRSAAQARDMVRDLRPAAVLGLGGFAAAPLVKAASKAGRRTALLNPDSVPGRANRYLAKRAGAIFTQFESTAESFSHRLRGKIRCVGCPVRAELLTARRDEAIGHFGLLPARKTLLIFGGSLMSASINEAAAALAKELQSLAETWQVLHVTGPAGGASEAYAGAALHARTLEYCDRMDLAYAAADLAVCRGGASTMAELAATATPAVILPYPHHRDRQQQLNAAALVRAGAAIAIDDTTGAANVAALRATVVPILADANRLDRMRRAAGGLSRPRAAEEVARWLIG